MKTCRNCGNQSPDDALFCDQCGSRLEREPRPEQAQRPEQAAPPRPEHEPRPEREQAVAPEAAAMPAAPAPQGARPEEEGRCPSCGAMNTPGELYCSECGSPLAQPRPDEGAQMAEAPAAEPENEGDGAHCIFCGAALGPDDTYCYACGAERSEAPGLPSRPAAPLSPATQEGGAQPEAAVAPAPQAPVEEQATLPVPEDVPVREDVPGEPVCPACGAKVTPGDAFCEFCGAAIVGAAGLPGFSAARPDAAQPATARPAQASAGAPRLVTAEGLEIPLGEGAQIIVGREDPYTGAYPDVDLTPHGGEEGGVSRRHFRITRAGNGFTIEDLNSTNRTLLNRTQLQPGAPLSLSDGDEIRAGRVRLVFRIG